LPAGLKPSLAVENKELTPDGTTHVMVDLAPIALEPAAKLALPEHLKPEVQPKPKPPIPIKTIAIDTAAEPQREENPLQLDLPLRMSQTGIPATLVPDAPDAGAQLIAPKDGAAQVAVPKETSKSSGVVTTAMPLMMSGGVPLVGRVLQKSLLESEQAPSFEAALKLGPLMKTDGEAALAAPTPKGSLLMLFLIALATLLGTILSAKWLLSSIGIKF